MRMEDQTVCRPGGSARKWVLGILAIVTLFFAGAVLLLFGVNRFYIDITPLEERDMLLEYGTEYQEPGAQVCIRGTVFFTGGFAPGDLALETSGTVDPAVLGEYTVEYASTYGWMEAREARTVKVVDSQAPVITLTDSGKPLIVGTPYEEEGFRAEDNHDGDLTDQVHRQELYGKVIYTVADSSGNETSIEREIPYYDPLPPTILLEGEKEMHLSIGQSYLEPGFLSVDNVDGDLTEQTEVEGEVDCFTPGIYEITYRATDGFFNQTVEKRIVEVTAQPRVDVKYPKGKVIYLTFDDGPGEFTDELLYLLDYYGVKATFFVTDSGYDDLMKRIVEEGHAIGIHTVNHNYDEIYQSPEAYFADLYAMQQVIYENTGVMTTLMRFPGGGSNLVSRRFYPGLMTLLTEAVQDAGFQYFDWNVDSNDAGGATTAEEVIYNVVEGVQRERVSIVLQHDIHPYSVNAVEEIILFGLNNGYTFLTLQEDSPGAHHPVMN